ncbi:MAG: hypothetical protein UIM53_08595, partial [Acutalibacteraceae bacterium]|nr:hypothetical protein [Acutalibacteraceae bacterium]
GRSMKCSAKYAEMISVFLMVFSINLVAISKLIILSYSSCKVDCKIKFNTEIKRVYSDNP